MATRGTREDPMPKTSRIDDPIIRSKVLGALEQGATRDVAARSAGIGPSTLGEWLRLDAGYLDAVERAERGDPALAGAAWRAAGRAAERSADAGPSAPREARSAAPGDPWARVWSEAEAYGPGIFGVLLWVDAKLVAAGFPAISPWWQSDLRRFYASKKRRYSGRGGRRGGKSSTMCRVAVTESLFVKRTLPPGETGVWPFFSVDKGEAADRLGTIEAILSVLGVEYNRYTKDSRERIAFKDVSGNSVELRVYPASVSGATGFTAIGATCDEVAKWKDEKTGANPASDVLSSLAATFLTQPDAHWFLFSSPFSTIDAHFDIINEGDIDLQYIARLGEEFIQLEAEHRKRVGLHNSKDGDLAADSANVPSWVMSPIATIEATLQLEKDPSKWAREYRAIPMSGGASNFFDHLVIDAAVKRITKPSIGVEYFAGLDPGYSSNSSALVVIGRKGARYFVADVVERTPKPGEPLDPDDVIDEFALILLSYYATEWMSDVHYKLQVKKRSAKNGIACVFAPNDNDTVYIAARTALGCGLVDMCGHAILARQVKQTIGEPSNGRIRIVHPDKGTTHGDLASAFIRGLWHAGVGKSEDTKGYTPLSVPSRYSGAR